MTGIVSWQELAEMSQQQSEQLADAVAERDTTIEQLRSEITTLRAELILEERQL